MDNTDRAKIVAEPHTGIAATYCIGSDSYGGEIVEVSPTKHRVIWQPAPEHHGLGARTFTRRKDGRYRAIGQSRAGYVIFGVADTHLDPGF